MSILDSAVLLLQAKNYSGSGNWLDESGNGHDAVPQNSPTFANGAFTLDGADQHFVVTNHADLDFDDSDDWTIMFVGTPASGTASGDRMVVNRSTNGYIFNVTDSGGNLKQQLFLDGSTGSQTTQPSGAEITEPKAALTMFAAVVDATDDGEVSFHSWQDGTFVHAATAVSITASGTYEDAANLLIGWDGAGDDAWNGTVEAVVLWRSALTPAAIEAALGLIMRTGSRMTTLMVP